MSIPIADSPLIVICVLLYLLVCLGTGIWAIRRTHTIADFLVASRTLGPMVVMLATMSSIMSGFGFVGVSGLVYESGISPMWIMFTASFGLPLCWVVVGKRLSLLSEAREVLTLPDIVEARYGGTWPRLLMAVAILLGVLGYLGTQILAMGFVLVAVLDVNLLTALLIGLGVLAFYSVAGGILAGVYTDMFQGSLMIFASLGVFYYALDAGGGLSEISTTLWKADPDFIGPWGTRGPMTAVSWFLLFAIGIVGQPHGITKFMMLRDVRDLKWGAFLTCICYGFVSVLSMGIGLSMRAMVESGVQSPLESPDLAAPLFLLHHTPDILAGLVFAGLLAASMSTADSFVNLGAAAIVHDIPKAWRGRPLRRELLWSRVTTALLLISSTFFAVYMDTLVALLGVFGWGTFAAAIVPSVAIGLNWKGATRQACVLSIAISLVLNFSLELLSRHGVYVLPHGLIAGCVSLLVSISIFILVSAFSTRSEGQLAPDVKAAMEV